MLTDDLHVEPYPFLIGKMSQYMSSAAVVIGALIVNVDLESRCITTR